MISVVCFVGGFVAGMMSVVLAMAVGFLLEGR